MAAAEDPLTEAPDRSTEPGRPMVAEPAAGSAGPGGSGGEQRPAAPIESSRSMAVATVVAWLALAALAVGAGLALWPVRNGEVQDCGVPVAFVLSGRQDALAAGGPGEAPPTPAEVERALDRPCRERVAERMVPASLSWLGGLVLGVGAFFATIAGRRRLRRSGPGTMDDHA